jgi:hypothetical protein
MHVLLALENVFFFSAKKRRKTQRKNIRNETLTSLNPKQRKSSFLSCSKSHFYVQSIIHDVGIKKDILHAIAKIAPV